MQELCSLSLFSSSMLFTGLFTCDHESQKCINVCLCACMLMRERIMIKHEQSVKSSSFTFPGVLFGPVKQSLSFATLICISLPYKQLFEVCSFNIMRQHDFTGGVCSTMVDTYPSHDAPCQHMPKCELFINSGNNVLCAYGIKYCIRSGHSLVCIQNS